MRKILDQYDELNISNLMKKGEEFSFVLKVLKLIFVLSANKEKAQYLKIASMTSLLFLSIGIINFTKYVDFELLD